MFFFAVLRVDIEDSILNQNKILEDQGLQDEYTINVENDKLVQQQINDVNYIKMEIQFNILFELDVD